MAVLLPELIEKSLILPREYQPWFLVPAFCGGAVSYSAKNVPHLFNLLIYQLFSLWLLLFLAVFPAEDGAGAFTQVLQQDFVLRGC